MIISASELRRNLSKYLKLVSKEDIYITERGKIVAVLSKPKNEKIEKLRKLVGIAGNDSTTTLEDIKEERLKRQ